MTPPYDEEPASAADRTALAQDQPTDGDTPPHGVPPVVVPRSLARSPRGEAAPTGTRPPVPRAERRGTHRRQERQRRGLSGRRRRWRLSRRGRAVLIALAVLIVAVAAGAGWYESEVNPSGSPGRAVIVHVRRGEPADQVVASLARDGVVDSSFAFRVWSFLHGQPSVRPGLYQLHRNLPFSTVSAKLSAGPNVYALDVVPGTTVAEIASQLSQIPGDLAQSFETEAKTGSVPSPYQPKPGTSLEGLIGAGSYRITPGESSKTLLEDMVSRFDREAKAAGLSPGSTVEGEPAYDVVTVASIAMKEGYFSRYFGQVARVVYNRLADGMALDMTSTVLYSLGQDGGPVTPAEEQDTTPYNTYRHTGLTPTPICTPSEAALHAAASPPAGTWLYFELTTAKKGVMVFSASYTTQLRAERQAQANAATSGTSGPSGSSGT